MAFVIVGSAKAAVPTGKTGWLVIGEAACALETIFRPTRCFWVFPLTAVWQHKKRRCNRLCGSGGLVCPVDFFDDKDGGSVFRRRHGFCRCRLLLQGHPIAAVRYEWERAVKLLAAAWQYVLCLHCRAM